MNDAPATGAPAYTYAPIIGDNFYYLRSDGEKIHAKTKEIVAARSDGRLPPPRSQTTPTKKTRDKTTKTRDGTARDPEPKVVRAPKPDAEPARKPTRSEQAAEYGALAGILFGTFALASNRPFVALTSEQQTDLGKALAGALPTLPGSTAKKLAAISPWVRLAMVTGNIVAPMVIEEQRLRGNAIGQPIAREYARAPIGEPVTSGPVTGGPEDVHPADRVFQNSAAA